MQGCLDVSCCTAGPAYLKMIEAAKAEQGELILVVLGPLTNVALACKLDSQLPSRGDCLLASHACLTACDSLFTAAVQCCVILTSQLAYIMCFAVACCSLEPCTLLAACWHALTRLSSFC